MAFTFALCALGYFGFKTISSTTYWMDPTHQDQALADWMTPRYVGQSYKLPREIVLEALMMDPDASPRRISIREIAEDNGVTMEDLQTRMHDAAVLWDTMQRPPRND